jgi:hypothetical protein
MKYQSAGFIFFAGTKINNARHRNSLRKQAGCIGLNGRNVRQKQNQP